jgi:hypothetical protein
LKFSKSKKVESYKKNTVKNFSNGLESEIELKKMLRIFFTQKIKVREK